MVNCDNEKDLKKRFGVSGYRTLTFFPKHNKEGEEYTQGRSEEALINFLNKRCGTNRVAGGRFDEQTGRFKEFDELAALFMKDMSSRESAPSKIHDVIEKNPAEKKSGEYYIKVMDKVVVKGDGFVTSEIARIQKLLEGHMTGDKRDEMFKRINALNVFKNAVVSVEL